MIKCSKCSRNFNESKDSVCPRCGRESSDLRLLQNKIPDDFEMPNGIKLSGTYKSNKKRKALSSLSLNITNSQISSYLHDSSKENTAMLIMATSVSIAVISGALLNYAMISASAFIIFIITLIYIVCYSAATHQICLEVNKYGINLSLPKEHRTEYFLSESVAQICCSEYERTQNKQTYKCYAVSLINTQNETYDILEGIPSLYLALYFKQEFEKILKINCAQRTTKSKCS